MDDDDELNEIRAKRLIQMKTQAGSPIRETNCQALVRSGTLLSEGKNSSVYKNGSHIIKVISRELADWAKKEIAFYEELSRFPSCHSNVICFVDSQILPDKTYLLFKADPDTVDLHYYITEVGSLTDVDDVRQVFVQLLEGLQYIHSKGIIHRDIKPHNILVSPDFGTVKYLDFGISCKLPLCVTMRSIGTIGYMPPDIATKGKTDGMDYTYSYDRLTDLYSLGKTFRQVTKLSQFDDVIDKMLSFDVTVTIEELLDDVSLIE